MLNSSSAEVIAALYAPGMQVSFGFMDSNRLKRHTCDSPSLLEEAKRLQQSTYPMLVLGIRVSLKLSNIDLRYQIDRVESEGA